MHPKICSVVMYIAEIDWQVNWGGDLKGYLRNVPAILIAVKIALSEYSPIVPDRINRVYAACISVYPLC
jgi:hypothetical protein